MCRLSKSPKERRDDYKEKLKRVGATVLGEQLKKHGVSFDQVEVVEESTDRRKRRSREKDDDTLYEDLFASEALEERALYDEEQGDDLFAITKKRISPGKPLRRSSGVDLEKGQYSSSGPLVLGVVEMEDALGFGANMTALDGTSDDTTQRTVAETPCAPSPYLWAVAPLHHLWTESLGYKTLVLMDISPTTTIEVAFDARNMELTFVLEYPAEPRLQKIRSLCKNHKFDEKLIRDLKARYTVRLPKGLKPLIELPRPSFHRDQGFVTVDFEAEASVASISTRSSVTMKW